ncbi:relaxase/mobilization nuclease domain-containing protein [Mesorhizobium caraganae]|uniref:relaxase/mobilization nuclease domain-containing protein n=1 Tax=Mesorhizobium caraganae TaxID=483206 RepID=UPI001939D86B|nr:relaxase/mobilization nuclease domain-containing protein [Mesorhizobium caraganae]MBM2715795.1 relaxase/mobilization nuclease domain-containing protein [Mesorhizobium caraganae]
MILKASQRADGKQLGLHLLRRDENDHVGVEEIRGFVANNVVDAFREAYAISRGTKCSQFLFSLSLSPPSKESVTVAMFRDAIERVERSMGLMGQPRAIVFHEKDGRRHAHCVWSRINAKTMKAINLPHFKMKLQELSRSLYIEHGWAMPNGLVRQEDGNPLNFSREEWQQAKRINRDPKAIKKIFQDCWAASDGLNAFRQTLEGRGYYLAQGDRRGHVAVDWQGEVYAVSRWTGTKAKEVVARLGKPDDLPDVATVTRQIKEAQDAKLDFFADSAKLELDSARQGLAGQREKLVLRQREERSFLAEFQAARWATESQSRAERFRTGIKGIWDRITGRRTQIARQNEIEIASHLNLKFGSLSSGRNA